jgi:phosphomannomutase
MSIIIDKKTGFEMGDPNLKPFSTLEGTTLKDVQDSLKPMILSASGWRKVFSIDADEESNTTLISQADKVLSAAMAKVFSDFVKKQTGKKNPGIVLAQDSRYTGTAIADVMIRVFIAEGLTVQYLFISAAPETFCYTKTEDSTDGFAYISASHNPIGHNGVKFGLSTGGVIDGSMAKPLIQDFKDALSTDEKIHSLINMANSSDVTTLTNIYNSSLKYREAALKAYTNFTNEIISGSTDKKEQQEFLKNLKGKIEKNGFGIVAEFNGSARTETIDSDYLNSIGVKVKRVNDKPREITHRIVPEGRSLNLCKETLESMYKIDKTFALGYVPDNDGDRGNVVFFNTEKGEAEIIEAQTVFAISVLAELSSLYYNGKNPGKVGVCVNGPTSMRIDEMTTAFGAETFRAEVGEANVVNLAMSKREEGYTVRILGEGSNGGNITFPAAVRDPLNTISAIMKLLMLTSESSNPGLFEIWCQKSDQMSYYKENFTLTDVIKTIPKYITTSAYEDRAILKITSESHAVLKKNYEDHFLKEWELKKDELKEKFDIISWEEINTEGLEEVSGMGPDTRSGVETGGLKILLKDSKENSSAYLWMRGSGTEPVFRVLVDSKSANVEKEAYLLNWQTNMIKTADSM